MKKKKINSSHFILPVEKKRLSARTVTKEINEVEGPENVHERVAPNWFRRFKEVDTSLKDKPKSGRPYIVEDVALLEMI